MQEGLAFLNLKSNAPAMAQAHGASKANATESKC
jgi:hypothetical protein